MQTLELVEDRFHALLNGEKTDTIRLDEGDIKPGLLLYVSYPTRTQRAVVDVTDVAYMPLRDVVDRTNDFERRPTPEIVLERMRRHYPEIKLETEILYVRHRTVAETFVLFPDDVAAILEAV